MPTARVSPGARWSAMSPPSLTKALSSSAAPSIAASSSSATLPATAAIGVMKSAAKGRTAATMRRATGPSTHGSSAIGRRSSPSSPASSARTVAKRATTASWARRTSPSAPHARSTTSIGPCDKCSRSPARLCTAAPANMRRQPSLATSFKSVSASLAVSGSRVRRETSAATARMRWTAARPSSVSVTRTTRASLSSTDWRT